MRKLSAHARVVFSTNGKPHPIVGTFVMLVAQYKDNLVINVHCEAAKHGVGLGRQLRDRIKHKLMRDNLAPRAAKKGLSVRDLAYCNWVSTSDFS